MNKIHMIGIGGSGLSAIAWVLLERGYEVSGSDREFSPQVQALQAAGAHVFVGHRRENVGNADMVLRSSAIPDDNVEILVAKEMDIPVLKRAEFISQLVAEKKVLAVAGTHGKTTTTSMLAWMLTAAGHAPSFVIGGEAHNLGRSAHAGAGDLFVIEADEYDYMFLGLSPELAVVTSVEFDHPDCFPTPDLFQRAFEEFVKRIKSGGVLLACKNDRGAEKLLAWSEQRGIQTFSYGIGDDLLDFWAADLQAVDNSGYSFDVHRRDYGKIAELSLIVPGIHNVLNALAVISIADLLGVDLQSAADSLNEFSGVGRRFEVRGNPAGVTIIDDYAHHPTEIRATLTAARTRYPEQKIWAVWQPHTYSRTRWLYDDFISSFNAADYVMVTDIYAAREQPPKNGFSSQDIVEGILNASKGTELQVYYKPSLSETKDFLARRVNPGDIVLVLTAGDAVQVSEGLVQDLENKKI